ncbi:hypothetical protein B0T26DRAFT_30667 [Lasiosphaeria miniovina]|uniref:Uncharacterized protein n=1 Tax=Lasiosphaeria miniovina TaxID=1954250 RepID=A0AA40BG55_9PEZI|nr:uncharacterized protein B0T26DRAFT_30667 [Lasiosphaeria miniovina]KAK0733637.1 hypothetical protein B0T26DRAFT_30667 [Lasiosphaeria miniovina]
MPSLSGRRWVCFGLLRMSISSISKARKYGTSSPSTRASISSGIGTDSRSVPSSTRQTPSTGSTYRWCGSRIWTSLVALSKVPGTIAHPAPSWTSGVGATTGACSRASSMATSTSYLRPIQSGARYPVSNFCGFAMPSRRSLRARWPPARSKTSLVASRPRTGWALPATRNWLRQSKRRVEWDVVDRHRLLQISTSTISFYAKTVPFYPPGPLRGDMGDICRKSHPAWVACNG